MFEDEEITTEDELPEDDLLNVSVHDDVPANEAQTETDSESDSEGVVWTREENGRLKRV